MHGIGPPRRIPQHLQRFAFLQMFAYAEAPWRVAPHFRKGPFFTFGTSGPAIPQLLPCYHQSNIIQQQFDNHMQKSWMRGMNTFSKLHKYNLQFGQICFAILTNTIG